MKAFERINPLVSVVTPVHQTPLPLFREAFQSLLHQTWGFDRMEWLVGIHNMDDAYAAALEEITDGRDNILLLRVEGGSTPSVPRNRCLERARGDYVFFLDSDDQMAPDCIEQAVSAMEESCGDLAVFSCALLSEPGAEALGTDFRLNAPDQEFVVYDKGDPRILSLMSEWGATLWCRAYSRRLLLCAGVRFDETVRMGEDYLFNLAVTPLAESVCVLPRLAGCFHRQWARSLVQSELSRGSEGDRILRYLPVLQEQGATELVWYQVSWFARRAVERAPDQVLSPRQRSALAPVLRGMRVMAPRFSYTEEHIAGMLGLCSAVFSIPDAPRIRQRFEVLEAPLLQEEVVLRVKAAAAENIELRTVGTAGPENPFLGVERPDALPAVCMLDLRSMTPERQNAHMEGFHRVELLRGFQNGEVRCRVSVFRLSALGCVLSLTWDDRFVGVQGIDRLRNRICAHGEGVPHYRCVGQMLRHRMLMAPDRPVFRWRAGDSLRAVTWEALGEQMDALAAALAAREFRSRRIAIAAPNSYGWVLLHLTLLREGMTTVALDPALSAAELGRRLERTHAGAVFLGDQVPEPQVEGVPCFRLSGLDALLEEGQALPKQKNRWDAVDTDREALIVFTSGTTGYGKAVVLTQRNLIAAARCSARFTQWYERCLLCLPLYHVGMHQALMCWLCMGSEILISTTQLDVMLSDCQRFHPQSIYLVPRLLELLRMTLTDLDDERAREFLGGSLKRIFCGSAPFPESGARFFENLGIRVSNQYGSTETLGPMSHSHPWKERRGAALYPFPETELRLGETGEILIRSPMVFAGYLDDPEATAQVLDAEGWFHTGDLGQLDGEDGALTITGRLKNLILFSNGENVSPEELEHQIARLSLVEECLVFGDRDETIAVRVYPTPQGRRMEPEELRQELWTQLEKVNDANPPYMHIDRLYISSAPLERNHMGKLKRLPPH